MEKNKGKYEIQYATLCPGCDREVLLKDLRKDPDWNTVCCIYCEDDYDRSVQEALEQ